MENVKPKLVRIPKIPTDLNLLNLQEKISDRLSRCSGEKSKTSDIYITTCTLANAVQAATIQYFIFLYSLSENEINKDLDSLLYIKTNTSIAKINLSKYALVVYNTALESIRNLGGVQNPQNMPKVLFSTFSAICLDLSLKHRPVTVLQRFISPLQLKNQIQEKIKLANINLSKTNQAYAANCALAQAVQQAALSFFSELLYLPPPIVDKAIETLFEIKTERTIPSTLSCNSLQFYQKTLSHIRGSNPSNKDYNPRNIGLILCRILLTINIA